GASGRVRGFVGAILRLRVEARPEPEEEAPPLGEDEQALEGALEAPFRELGLIVPPLLADESHGRPLEHVGEDAPEAAPRAPQEDELRLPAREEELPHVERPAESELARREPHGPRGDGVGRAVVTEEAPHVGHEARELRILARDPLEASLGGLLEPGEPRL